MEYDIRRTNSFIFILAIAFPFLIIALMFLFLLMMAVSFFALVYMSSSMDSYLFVLLISAIGLLFIALMLSFFAKKIWGADEPVRLITKEKSLTIIFQRKAPRDIPWSDITRFRITINPKLVNTLGVWRRPDAPWLFFMPYFRLGSGILLELVLKDNTMVNIDVYDTPENAVVIGKDIDSRI